MVPSLASAQTAETADTLAEVVVTAHKAEAIVTPGMTTYTPSATLSGSGGSAFDAISSLPGVSTDNNGSLSVNGVRGITVTINGRKGALKGSELTNYLKSLPATAVADIRIRTTPSAKDDASSSQTVIDVRLRKHTDRGLTLNSSARIRTLRGVEGYGNIRGAYSTSRAIASLAYTWAGARQPSRLYTLRPVDDTEDMLTQEYRRTRHDAMNNVSASLQLMPTEKLTAGAILTYNSDNRRERARMVTLTPPGDIPSRTWNAARFATRTLHGTAFASWKLPSPESAVEIGIDFFDNRGDERQHITSDTTAPVNGDTGGTTKGYVGTIDWHHTISGHWWMSAGARVSVVDMKNDGTYAGGDSRKSRFGHLEDNEALYAEARMRYGAVTATAGLRAERTGMRSRFSGEDAPRLRHAQTELFPSASVIMQTVGSSAVGLSYGRRTSRPRYADLNPFVHIFDDITYVAGNIRLRPAISHNLYLSWSHAGWLRVSLGAILTDGAITRCYTETDNGRVYVRPENLPHHTSATLGVSAVNLRPARWLVVSASASTIWNRYRFPQGGDIHPVSRLTPMADIRCQFHLPAGWSAELSGSYCGRMVYGQALTDISGKVYAGARKSLPHGLGNVTLFINDLFDTNRRRSAIILPGGRTAMTDEREAEDMRRIGVSVSIRFHSGKAIGKGYAKDLPDEIKRVNLQ